VASATVVGLLIEISEQEIEKHAMTSDPIDEDHWVVAGVMEDELEAVRKNSNKLNHLNLFSKAYISHETN
jgi:hypothetical protein